jgi:predicted PolB exonuclease-like 3'-5' exonuclease
MFQDEIVEEIHRIREEYSRSFDHDLKAMFADLQKQQAESGQEVVNLSRQRSLVTGWSGCTRREFGENADASLLT